MLQTIPPTRRSRRGLPSGPRLGYDSEAGSAYLVVLLVLLLLTIMGLSLTLVTQIESEIGTTERMIHRTFYAADSGAQAAVARKMTGAVGPFRFQMNSDQTGPFSRGDLVDVANFFPVRVGFSNLSSANVGSETYRIDYLSLSEGTRFGSSSPTGGNRHPIARQAVSTELAIDPDTGPAEFLGIDKPSAEEMGERMGNRSILP